jgi:hypothetical protein
MAQRSFVVRVSGSSPRVIVEDVRTREKIVADSLAEVGEAIDRWLQEGAAQAESMEAGEEIDA